MSVKTCIRCKEAKGTDCFNKDKSQRGGFASKCKTCRSKERETRKKHIKSYDRDYYAKNRNKWKAWQAEFRAKNPSYVEEWLARHPNYNRDWQRRHAERYREQDRVRRALYAANPLFKNAEKTLMYLQKGLCVYCGENIREN